MSALKRYKSITVVFAAGEAASLAAPIVGTASWFTPWIFGPIALLAVVIMAFFAVLTPLGGLGEERGWAVESL